METIKPNGEIVLFRKTNCWIFPKKTIGYSDHTSSDLACLASILYGAKIIEKHLSIKFNVKNSQDWKVSLDKKKF